VKEQKMNPRLYIVMREDISDMNPGKAMAQSAHAQAEFDAYMNAQANSDSNEFWKAVSAWREEREFGTTLVLSATLEEMRTINDISDHSGMTVDPTYPWRNWYGEMFTSEEITCMWCFVYREEEVEYMRQFDLHP
jgi:peptidyl-tRNA hydrolase